MTAWPFAARAQQPGKLPTIGFIGTVTQSEWPVEAFDKRLRELGWIEGRTITIEYHWAEGRDERITEFVAEFVRSKVDVIVTGGNAVSAESRRHRLFLSFSLWLRMRLAAVSSIAWRDQEAMSPASRCKVLSSLVGDLIYCAKFSPVATDWPSWPMLAIRLPNRNWLKLRPRLARLASKSRQSKSGVRKMSPQPLRRSNLRLTRFMLLLMRSFPLTTAASLPLHSASGCRRSSHAIMPKRVRSCPMDQNSQLYSGAPLSMWTRFCAGPSPAISQSSSRLNSISSSISPPRGRSGSKYHTTYSCW